MGLTQKLGTIPLAILTDTSNNVGIGGSPSGTYKFEVTGTAKVSSTLLVSGAATFSSSVTAANGTFYNAAGGTIMNIYSDNTTTDNILLVRGNSGSTIGLAVKGSGNVGIGTSSPSALLEIANASNPSMFVTNTGAATLRLQAATGVVYAGSKTSDHFDLITGDTPRMRITSDGKAQFTPGTTGATVVNINSSLTGSQEISYGVGRTLNTQGSAFFGWRHNGGAASSYGFIETYGGSSPLVLQAGGGVVCVGTTAAFTSGLVCSDGGTSFVPFAAKVGTTTNAVQIYFNNPNGVVGSISTSGSTTTYNITSDYRLKQDLKDFNGLDLIGAIKTYDYEWKSDNTRAYGVLAHELQEVLPYAVHGEKDAEEMQGVDYSKIVPILVKAIQEQNQLITSLQDRLDKAGL